MKKYLSYFSFLKKIASLAFCIALLSLVPLAYQNGVSIDRVDALIGKMEDIPGIVPIMATSHKYQSGAMQKAKNHNIELLVVRE